jgi:hypothetical protein
VWTTSRRLEIEEKWKNMHTKQKTKNKGRLSTESLLQLSRPGKKKRNDELLFLTARRALLFLFLFFSFSLSLPVVLFWLAKFFNIIISSSSPISLSLSLLLLLFGTDRYILVLVVATPVQCALVCRAVRSLSLLTRLSPVFKKLFYYRF